MVKARRPPILHGVSPKNGRRTLGAHPWATSLLRVERCDSALRAVRSVTSLRDQRKIAAPSRFQPFLRYAQDCGRRGFCSKYSLADCGQRTSNKCKDHKSL